MSDFRDSRFYNQVFFCLGFLSDWLFSRFNRLRYLYISYVWRFRYGVRFRMSQRLHKFYHLKGWRHLHSSLYGHRMFL